MARTVLAAFLIVLLNVMVGCNNVDGVKSKRIPTKVKQETGSAPIVAVSTPGELDIVEQVASHRQAYRQALNELENYYANTGNSMKLAWARKELAAVDTMPQYNYIIEANVAGPGLKAVDSIPEAEALYEDAIKLQKKAEELVVFKDDELLRLALDKYNQLIRVYPSSDKIDDAAFHAGVIHESFKDYSLAVLYYKRTFQWDPETKYPAEFKAANILDWKLKRYDEALVLYQKVLEKGGLLEQRRELVEGRIKKFSKPQKLEN